MDLRLLRTFQVAARHLNFSQTAEALYLSQPTVSNHIKQLERELGCELFERSGRSVRLTPAGEQFTAYASRLLEHADTTLQEFFSWLAGREERLSVAASPMVARSVLPWILRTYRERMPTVQTVISVLVSEEIPAVVANGEAEIGFSRIEPDYPRLTGEILHPDPVIFVAPPCTYNENAAPYRNWQEAVRRFPLITHNHPGYWDDLLLAIDQILPRLFTMVVTQVDITKRLIEAGLGTSFLPRSAVYSEIRTGKMVELPVPELVLPISASWLVFRADKHMTAGAKAFVELARNLRDELTTKDFDEILG